MKIIVRKIVWSLVFACCFILIPSYFYLVIYARSGLQGPAQAVVLVPALVAFVVSFAVALRNKELEDALAKLDSVNLQLQNANASLRAKSETDSMTGMLNRDTYFMALEKMRRKSDIGTLLIVDADHFKAINDNYGHLTGDEALVAITSAISEAVRDEDILGRIGGEEFGVFLTGAAAGDARIVAERIRSMVEAIRFEPRPGCVHPLTVSVGGITARMGGSIPQLMRAADACLYQAKDSGRNRVIITESMAIAA